MFPERGHMRVGSNAASCYRGYRRFFGTAFFVSLVFFTVSSWGQLERGEYEAIKAVSLELLRRHRGEDVAFVGIGRSPTPIMAFLDNRNIHTQTVPLSELSGQMYDEIAKKKMPITFSSLFRQRPTVIQERLAHYFERRLPDRILNGHIKMVIVDYVNTGDSIVNLSDFFRTFRRTRHPNLHVEYEVLVTPMETVIASQLRQSGFGVIEVPEPVASKLMRSGYEHHAKYGRYTAWSAVMDELALQPRVEYQEFRDHLLRAMNQDPSLGCNSVRFLRK